MKLRLEPTEIDRATNHLDAVELGCWFRLALHYTDMQGNVPADDGELKTIMRCPSAAFARVKGQVAGGRPWMFTLPKPPFNKLKNAELDAMLERARNQTAAALQTTKQPT